jgi:hypothetical protein
MTLSTNKKGRFKMTLEQIKWCKNHDWFLGEFRNGVKVWDVSKDSESIRFFNDYKEVRRWAGY